MKLPLRYFLIVCLLLGAVCVPWAWRTYSNSRLKSEIAHQTIEIKILKEELAELLEIDRHFPTTAPQVPSNAPNAPWGGGLSPTSKMRSIPIPRPKAAVRIAAIADRLETLTGWRPPTNLGEVDPLAPRSFGPNVPLLGDVLPRARGSQ